MKKPLQIFYLLAIVFPVIATAQIYYDYYPGKDRPSYSLYTDTSTTPETIQEQLPYKMNLGIVVGYPIGKFTRDDISERTRDNVFVSTQYRYSVLEWLSIGLNVDYTMLTTNKSEMRWHYFTIMPVAELRYTLYGGGGGSENQSRPCGFAFVAVGLGADIAHVEGFSEYVDEKANFTLNIITGAEFFVSNRVALLLELSYFYKEYRYENLRIEMSNGFRFGIGPRIYF